MEINRDLLEKISDYFTIVHHTPGRIRLRVSSKLREDAKASSADTKNLIDTIKKIPIIKDIKINLIVGSLTVQYDPELFDSSLWESWIKKERLDEILEVILKLKKELENDTK